MLKSNRLRVGSDQALAIDVVAVVGVGAAACTWAQHLWWMTALVLAAFVIRLATWHIVLPEAERGRLGREVLFLLICTVLGAVNDWNTVVRHGVYSYGVPSDLPHFSSIPTWMLLYWGLILRSITTLASWKRLGKFEPAATRDVVFLPGIVLRGAHWKIGAQLVLIVVTRQAIYRLWADPIWSWLPFATALVVYQLMLRPNPRERRLALTFAIVGPVAESLLIGVGGLHRYSLGWIFGVPLWILLWWVLAVLIWADLAPRLRERLGTPMET